MTFLAIVKNFTSFYVFRKLHFNVFYQILVTKLDIMLVNFSGYIILGDCLVHNILLFPQANQVQDFLLVKLLCFLVFLFPL